MALYDPKSPCADEFINHQEIVDTLAYAEAHKDDLDLCRRILAKAHPNVAPKEEHCTCITHREAAVLLMCDDLVREYGNMEKADKMKQASAENNWIAVSMRDDWKTIYGDGVTRK